MIDVESPCARPRVRCLRLLRARSGRRADVRVDRCPRGHVPTRCRAWTDGIDQPSRRVRSSHVLAGLLRRGEDFDAAEDALQDALLEALRVWPAHPPQDARAWLTTVAIRRLVDARRSEAARQRVSRRPTRSRGRPGRDTEEGDDTLLPPLLLLSPRPRAHVPGGADPARRRRPHHRARSPTPSTCPRRRWRSGSAAPSAPCVAAAWTSPATSRSCCACSPSFTRRSRRPGDLAGEAIRLTRQLTLATEEPEARGLLALMLLQPRPAPGAARPRRPDRHARRAGPLRLGHREIAEGVPSCSRRSPAEEKAPGPLPARGRDRRPARRRGQRR